MGIAEVSFFAGTLLFFVAIIGGGIEIKELKIPQITGSARYSCLAGSLMFLGLGLYLKMMTPTVIVPTPPATVKVETPAISTTPTTLPIQPTPNQQTPVTTPTQQTTITTATQPSNTERQTLATTEQTPPSPTPENTDKPKDETEKSILAKHYAGVQLEDANKRLNEVWNATTADIRNELLPKQRAWLKQREADCAAKAANEQTDDVMKEALKLGCMAKLTEPRIEQLKQEITELEESIIEEPDNKPAVINTTSIHEDIQANAKQQAKQKLDDANKRLNQVWNATTADIRKELLPEQREWLKKREDDCTAQAINEDKTLQDVLKLTCMANMTDPRTEELKQKIADLTQ